MIRFLLDTNIVSYFVKGISTGLVQRMQVGLDAQDIAISAITRAELRYGVEMMDKFDKRRKRIGPRRFRWKSNVLNPIM